MKTNLKKSKIVILILLLSLFMMTTYLFSCSSFSTTTNITIDSASVQGLKYDKVNTFESREPNR